MTNDERPLTGHERTNWTTAEPSADFASSVAEVWRRERRSSPVVGPRRLASARWAIAATLAAALLIVVWGPWRDAFTPASGEQRFVERKSVSLSERAVAVGEAGAELHWQIDGAGVGQVEQRTGTAFYRVNPGPRFEVSTPHGVVNVTGTCFQVEIKSMMNKSNATSAALGAVVAAAVTVTVYEGQVVLASDDAPVLLGPGEHATMGAGAVGPAQSKAHSQTNLAPPPAEDASAPELAAYARKQSRAIERLQAIGEAQTAEVESLRKQLHDLGATPVGPRQANETGDEARAKACAKGGRTDGCSFVEPDQATLLEMARCGTVRSDSPSLLADNRSIEAPPNAREALGVTDAEYSELASAIERHRAESHAALRQLFVDAGGGSPEQALDVPLKSLDGFIEGLLERDVLDDARRDLAHERAGLRDPANPAALSVAERFARFQAERGNSFEAVVASVLGPERARMWRSKDNGWSGNTSVWSGNCRDLPSE